MKAFFAVIGALAVANVLLAFIPVPIAWVKPIGMLVGFLFVAAPIYAIFRGADHPWTTKVAWAFLAVGVALHLGLGAWARSGTLPGAAGASIAALSQMGLMVWCIGLGGLLGAGLIKEPNLLIPVSVFLIAFDIFLVLTPVGMVQQVLVKAPQVFTSVAYQVPKVSDTAAIGPVGAAAYIGPADFIFMAMFFVGMYRFQMNPKGTLFALIPTLALYLAAVFLVGPLPALPPIALCVLAVNFKYFKLKRDEWAATAVLAALMAGLLAFSATRPKPPAVPLRTVPSPESRELEGLPQPTSMDRRLSPTLPDAGSR